MSYYILIINLLNKELFLLWVPNCFPILGGKRHSKIPCRWRWNILLPTSVEITPDIFIEFTIIYIINNAFQVYMLQLNCYSNLLCSGCEEIARNYATGKGGHRPLTLLPSTTSLSVDTLNPLVPFPFLNFPLECGMMEENSPMDLHLDDYSLLYFLSDDLVSFLLVTAVASLLSYSLVEVILLIQIFNNELCKKTYMYDIGHTLFIGSMNNQSSLR